MKTFLKFCAIHMLCQALVCSGAYAGKKDKSDDSKDPKRDKQEQTSSGSVQTQIPQQAKQPKPQPFRQPEPQQFRQPKPQQPKQSKPQQVRQPEPQQFKQPKPQQVRQPEPQIKEKTVKPWKSRGDSPSHKIEKVEAPSNKLTTRKEKNGKDGTETSRPNTLFDKHPRPDKGDKADKPMPLPGKRQGADKGDKDKGDKADKPMTLPGKRQGADKGDKDKGDKTDKPMTLPGKRQGADKGDKDKADKNKANKPLALPGKRPLVKGADNTKNPDGSPKVKGDWKTKDKLRNPTADNKQKVVPRPPPVVRPGQNTKQVKRPDLKLVKSDNSKAWWNSGNRINSGNKTVRINNITNINQNFQNNVNWSTHRNHWGYNPWWNRPVVRPWYGSSWNCGWNRDYYRHHYHYDHWHHGYRPPGYYVDPVQAIGWGLIGWSLGTVIYDTGYRSYYNPYRARPVYVSNNEEITYDQPITQVAVNSAPKDDAAVEEITRKSESLIAESQTAFKAKNYLVALELADKAIAQSPGDGALHEYRALVLFALGKYGDAAGVLNPVLASGPGWDWSTMVALYDSQETYTDQLQRLEAYTEEKPDGADTHFLLGYHYMVCGHLDLATPQFELASKLMPKDSVSKELAALTRSSSKSTDEAEPAKAEEPDDTDVAPAPEPVPLEKLTGNWVSTRDGGGTITLNLKDDGKFTWTFVKDAKTSEFSGEYSINDDGRLVLDSSETQMVASVNLPQENEMNFVLAGGPPDDSGIAFNKS